MPIRAANPAEFDEAVTLLHAGLAEGLRQQRIDAVLGLLRAQSIPAEGLIVAHEGPRLVGAILALSTAGHVGLVRPPGTVCPDGALEDGLIRAALDWLDRRGCSLVQSLAAPGEIERHQCLTRHGFDLVTRLWYLHHPLDADSVPASDRIRFTLIPMPEARERIGNTLLASYQGTLDFPELSVCRSLDDILAGHRAGTLHDPDRWWLIEVDGQDAGVALVGMLPDTGEWDLSYFGLVPTARGTGLARRVLGEILRRALLFGIPRMVLAVDERNLPAWHLYRAMGFVPDEAREVFLRIPGKWQSQGGR